MEKNEREIKLENISQSLLGLSALLKNQCDERSLSPAELYGIGEILKSLAIEIDQQS